MRASVPLLLFTLLFAAPPQDTGALADKCNDGDAQACLDRAHAADLAYKQTMRAFWLEKGCAAGAGQACHEAAQIYGNGDPKWIAALQKGCAALYAASCRELETAYRRGAGVHQNDAKADQYHQLGCTADPSSAGCVASEVPVLIPPKTEPDMSTPETTPPLGDETPAATATATDTPAAAPDDSDLAPTPAQLETRCNGGDASACIDRAYSDDLRKRQSKRIVWLQKGCDLANGTACRAVAEIYGPGDPKWLSALDKGCNAKDAGCCQTLEDAYTKGTGVKKSPTRVAHFHELRCAADPTLHCPPPGFQADTVDPTLAAEEGRCAGGDGLSCDDAATTLAANGDRDHAVELWKKGCLTVGHAGACSHAGKFFDDAGDGDQAVLFYDVACNGGDKASCARSTALKNGAPAGATPTPAP